MTITGRRLVRLLTGALAAPLAFGAPAAAHTPVVRPGAGTSTFKTATIKSAGVSLRFPSGWTTLPHDPKALAAQQRQLAKRNPKLALSAAQQAQFLQTAKFEAVDLRAAAAGRFATNVNVAAVDTGGFPASLDEVTASVRSQYAQEGITLTGASQVKIGGTTGYRTEARLTVTLANGTPVPVLLGQLALPHHGGSLLVTVTAGDDSAGAQLTDVILGSVRLR